MKTKDFQTSFEKSRPGRRAHLPSTLGDSLPAHGVPAKYLRKAPPALPELSEVDVVRHFTALSRRNVGVDSVFYPLGSCTMKYNPKINEAVAAMPGFAHAHPCLPDSAAQGILSLLSDLESLLCEISGFKAVSLQPAAGAHGELTGLMMIKAYHDKAGNACKTVLVPDSAHGTNPASCTLAGFKTKVIKSGKDGLVDLDDLGKNLGPDTAAMMLTNPNTLGLFEERVCAMASMLHEKGALLYMDGANMNAILGKARPGDFGVDVMHFNLHKTFSTPHGGGGPGSGPVGVGAKLEPFLPTPRIVGKDGALGLSRDFPDSIGPVRSWLGNVGVAVKAWAYIRHLGPEGIRDVTENAVLNANYVMAKLKDVFPPQHERPCMHECVLTAKRTPGAPGLRALDVAKGLIDRGFHPPTIYFPLIVPEALMIEPTETETVETLDDFVAAMREIAEVASSDLQSLQAAPATTPVGRLDEVKAVKEPVLRQPRTPR